MNRLLIALMTVVGFGCMLLCGVKDWFYVPEGTLDAVTMQGTLGRLHPRCVPLYQGIMVIGVLLLAASWIHRFRWSKLSVVIACGLLLIAGSFPHAVMISDPRIAGRATWLQMQYDNLLWVGGDISTSHELSRTSWKSKVYVIDAPRQVSVVKLPAWSPWEIGLERLPFLIEWLGYTDSFCQFVRTGWMLAMMGGVILLACTFAESGCMKLERARLAVSTMSFGFILLSVAGWSGPLYASHHVSASARSIAKGEFEEGLKHLETASIQFPVIAEDTYYIAQKGLLEHRLKIRSPYARMYAATLMEQDGQFASALEEYQKLVNEPNASLPLKREARRAILRYAIHALNSGNSNAAAIYLTRVLKDEPCNLKAIYVLQVATLRNGGLEKTKDLVDHTYRACEYFRFPTKKVLLSASQQHATFAAMLSGDADTTWQRFRKANRP